MRGFFILMRESILRFTQDSALPYLMTPTVSVGFFLNIEYRTSNIEIQVGSRNVKFVPAGISIFAFHFSLTSSFDIRCSIFDIYSRAFRAERLFYFRHLSNNSDKVNNYLLHATRILIVILIIRKTITDHNNLRSFSQKKHSMNCVVKNTKSRSKSLFL